MRSLILCLLWGAVWGMISSRVGIEISEVAWWLIAIFGSMFITFTVRD